MKRTISKTCGNNFPSDDNEPHSKVALVEREVNPCGISLVNSTAIAKKSYVDSMELEQSVSNVSSAIQANAKNKLEVIGRQMKHLHELMSGVFEDTKLSIELHNAACNFIKKPGHIYHLYQRPSGQQYFGMLSPEEWQNPPHEYLGSFILEADHSWTPANSCSQRNQGVSFLKQMFGMTQLQALT